MLAGPIFHREFMTSPRQLRHYLIRSGYVAALLVLMYTIRTVTIGFQDVTEVGATARYGNLVFQVASLVQMLLILFFALLFSAAGIAQEKDRQTLILLLMTDLKDRELVLGKLGANLLMVFVLIIASIPAFFLIHQLGGVTIRQITWSLILCVAAALAVGSWGALVGFWRESTFQTLAVGGLGVVLFIGMVEAVTGLVGAESAVGQIVGLFDPFRALWSILSPMSLPGIERADDVSAFGSVVAMLGLSVVFIVVTTSRLRVWNPSRSVFRNPQTIAQRTRTKHRSIWTSPVIFRKVPSAFGQKVIKPACDLLAAFINPLLSAFVNPVIWREIRTTAYGRKVIVIKLAYGLLAVFITYRLLIGNPFGDPVMGMISPLGFSFVGLSLLTMMLVNAQAVTSLTTERDGRTLELLLMTDVTAKEFVFGKLGGVLYNWKEVILIPLLLAAYFVIAEGGRLENLVFLLFGYLTLVLFAASLGLHSGMTYDQSRSAIANSLGTMFFLFIGIFIFMLLLIEARSLFLVQFQSFFAVIVAGSIALFASLARRNPSMAFGISATGLPFLTFYAITEFLLHSSLSVCVAICAAYGFTTLAMLVPAVSEFDAALGRTSHGTG